MLDNWNDLKSELLAAHEDWVVWTVWYDDRLRGTPGHQDIEVARVTIPNETWDQGPKVLNSRIRAIFQEHGITSFATGDQPEREPRRIANMT